jgi:X-X-X-Leu-X-X-Gly heptad repeat protein
VGSCWLSKRSPTASDPRVSMALRAPLRQWWLGGNRGRARMSPRTDPYPAADEAGASRARRGAPQMAGGVAQLGCDRGRGRCSEDGVRSPPVAALLARFGPLQGAKTPPAYSQEAGCVSV